jgi:hypothetical protein
MREGERGKGKKGQGQHQTDQIRWDDTPGIESDGDGAKRNRERPSLSLPILPIQETDYHMKSGIGERGK